MNVPPIHRRIPSLLRRSVCSAAGGATTLSWLCLALALVHALHSLRIGWDMPLLDLHAFRQTHTALSAWTIAQGGPLIGYETPVFGAPWSIPLEFPLYQWLTVLLRPLLGTSLDETGRAVSATFVVATALPLWKLLGLLDVAPNGRRLALACFFVSPLYVYWSRTFMIESTVLFFSVSACTLGLDELKRRTLRPSRLALGSACAVIAAAMKLMTVYGWLTMLAMFWLAELVRVRAELRAHAARLAAHAGAMFGAPLLAAIAWTHYADLHKGANVLARDLLLASNQIAWNFGTWDQKLAFETWRVLWTRTLDETLGHSWLFVSSVVVSLCTLRSLTPVLAPLLGLFAVYATFTNLHVIHDYYQVATGLFVILAAATGIDSSRAWPGDARG